MQIACYSTDVEGAFPQPAFASKLRRTERLFYEAAAGACVPTHLLCLCVCACASLWYWRRDPIPFISGDRCKRKNHLSRRHITKQMLCTSIRDQIALTLQTLVSDFCFACYSGPTFCSPSAFTFFGLASCFYVSLCFCSFKLALSLGL